MTSKQYLKFLAWTNITWFSIFSLVAILEIIANSWQFLQHFTIIATLLAVLVIIFAYYYPKKYGINPYTKLNKDGMKQSILYWTKDEREIEIALKVYANAFIQAIYFFLVFWIVFCSSLILDWHKTTIIIFIICYCLLFFWWSNIKMILDWNRYSA
ncbi:hypothetical protein [Periweissella beninensis]|uniref:hypothetical protein n=1 Tax=Periweissella beninensis TaxID=504936 RepID=UPI0021A92F68|nr:hypothetical protein [Periweissella beninensis]MCT4396476.1 hypothetical protein [Periweissella beninensis]